MTKCKEYDEVNRKCRSGWVTKDVFCSGKSSNVIPHCMWEEPPKHLITSEGLPIGWKNATKENEQ